MNRDDELGGLWLKTSQATGKKYMTGKINGVEVVVFKNEHKQDGELTPDYRVYRSKPRDEQPALATRNAERGEATRRRDGKGYDDLPDYGWHNLPDNLTRIENSLKGKRSRETA